MENLEKLKSELNSGKDLQVVFYEYSERLMNEYYLQIEDKKIELCEIEFYYYDEKNHPDCYSHLNELQKNTCGKLYVHDSSNIYNRVGIDLTFGNGEYYGGILIRGIKDKDEGKFIAGPANVRQYLEKQFCPHINKINFSNEKSQKCFEDINIKIIKKERENNNILLSIREGLTDKFKKYRFLLYRYIREDYAQISSEFFYKRSLPSLPLARAISTLTNITDRFNKQTSVQKEIEKIKQNQDLKENIKKFKENYKKNNNS